MPNPHPLISISVVSHGQISEIYRMLHSLTSHMTSLPIEIILTENVQRRRSDLPQFNDFSLKVQINFRSQGFAYNHNRAFAQAKGKYFVIINPNVIFIEDIFESLIEDIEVGRGDIVAPLVINMKAQVEDSFRKVPSPKTILLRRLFPNRYLRPQMPTGFVHPDWLAGLFLLMKADLYRDLGGLNEGYFMYFEDVDFACRARQSGYRLLLDHRVRIIHERTRANRYNPRHLYWHLKSAIRFFTSEIYQTCKELPHETEFPLL